MGGNERKKCRRPLSRYCQAIGDTAISSRQPDSILRASMQALLRLWSARLQEFIKNCCRQRKSFFELRRFALQNLFFENMWALEFIYVEI